MAQLHPVENQDTQSQIHFFYFVFSLFFFPNKNEVAANGGKLGFLGLSAQKVSQDVGVNFKLKNVIVTVLQSK